METDSLIKIGTFVFPLFMSGIGFFLMRLLRSFDELSKSHADFREHFTTKMALVERELEQNKSSNETLRDIVLKFEGIKRDIELAVQVSKELVVVKEDTTILRRDQSSIWKRIDELRGLLTAQEQEIEMLRTRTHWIANKMTILKAKGEKSGWEFKEEWEWPPKG